MTQTPNPHTQTVPLPGPSTTTPLPAPGGGGPNPPRQQGRLVFLALGLAVVAVVLMNIYIEVVKRQDQTGSFTVYVLTSSAQPGDQLQDTIYRQLSVPDTFEFQGAFEELNAVLESDGLPDSEGEYFERFVPAGALITRDMFQRPEGDELDDMIPRDGDQRAYSIPVNTRDLVSLIRPRMRVDVLGRFQIDGVVEPVIVMENVYVVGIAGRSAMDEQDARPGDENRLRGFGSIDVRVTQEEARQLAVLKTLAIGSFELLLRNSADNRNPSIESGGINPRLLQLIDYAPSDR